MMGLIRFHYSEVKSRLRLIKTIKKNLNQIFISEGFIAGEIDFIFCTDQVLLVLNANHLNHHTLTDILTFDLSEDNSAINAEIYISTERVAENAVLFGVSFRQELIRVMIHGVLHLCGYNDHSKQEILQMRSKEDYYLSVFNKTANKA